ncbi:MAG: flagellar basal body protein [Gammaproteobacteria bacterium]|nr:flagellar basal body protein [Gammaproteobacteria bacterium]
MNGIYNVAIRSLMAYQTALSTTSQNIANVNTPYYARKQVDFEEGIFGNGVNVADINRIYDLASSQNVLKSNSVFAKMDTYLTQLKSFEPLLDQDNASVGKFINDSVTALQQLNVNTSSIQGRLSYMTALTNLSNQFGIVNSQIQQQLTTVNQSLTTYANEANQITDSIATINAQLLNLPTGADASALLDQREQHMQQLATYLDFTTQIDVQGNLNIFMSNGLPLVSGPVASPISTTSDPANASHVLLLVDNGGSPTPISGFIENGQVAGEISFRDTLTQAQRALGRLALVMADTLNAQNKLGVDYNGNLGGNIFNDVNGPNIIATRVSNNLNNTGSENLSVVVNDVTQLTTSDYQLRFDSASHYTLMRLSDNAIVSNGAVGALPQSVNVDGFSLNINSGTIQAGDSFTVSPTKNAIPNMSLFITDPKFIALGMPVVAQPNVQNVGAGLIDLTEITDTTTAAFATAKQLSPPITIKFLSPTSYQIMNATSSAVIEGPLSYNPATGATVFPSAGGYDPGYRVSLSGAIQAGDSFNISYNQNSIGDNRNGMKIAALYQNGILDNNTVTFAQGYHMLSTDVSIQTNSAQIQYDSAKTLQKQAMDNYNQISAVSLEEESINLANYQQAYQASAQVLQVAKTVFESVIAMLRG